VRGELTNYSGAVGRLSIESFYTIYKIDPVKLADGAQEMGETHELSTMGINFMTKGYDHK